MAVTIAQKHYAEWADQALVRRQNPGGYSPSVTRCLYLFAGTVDLSKVVSESTKIGVGKIRVGFAAAQGKNIDLSTAVDITAVTAAEFASAITAAGFTGITASVETSGDNAGRVKIANSAAFTPESGTVDELYEPLNRAVQLWGDLFAAANAGDCRYQQGKGCYFYPAIDGTLKSAIGTENWDDDTVIEDDNGRGNKLTDTYPGGRGTVSLEIIDQRLSVEFKQMVDGGKWLAGTIAAPEYYEPLSAGEVTDNRRLDIHTFRETFKNRNSTAGVGVGKQERIYIGGTGHVSEDESNGGWSNGHSTITVAAHQNPNETDPDMQEKNSPVNRYYTATQAEASHYESLAVTDWDAVAVA